MIDGPNTVCGHVYVPDSSPLLQTVLEHAHNVSEEGTQKTLHRLRADFFVPSAWTVVRDNVRACMVRQRNKPSICTRRDGYNH
jgi:hypothetical protein